MMENPNAYTVRNEDFVNPIDVVCPKCNSHALILGARPYALPNELDEHVRFSCISCGYVLKYGNIPKFTIHTNSRGKNMQGRVFYFDSDCDPFFHFDLWYRIDIFDAVLWAYNLEHLSVIEHYIAQKQRSRNGLPNKNNSIASRLPQWAKSSKNRLSILKSIALLKIK